MSGQTGNDNLNLRDAAAAIGNMLDDSGEPQGDMHIDRTKGQRNARERIEEGGGAVDVDVDEDDEPEEDSERRSPRQEAESDVSDNVSDDDADDDDEDAVAINSIEDIARELGQDVEELLGNLSHSFKASGKVETATLADIVKGYQRNADYTREKQSLADARRAFEVEQRQRTEAYQRDATLHAQQLAMVRQILEQDLQSPELVAMQQTDPATYLIRTREIEGRIANLEQQRQQAAYEYQTRMQQVAATRMDQERSSLMEKVPEWGEDKLGQAVEVIRGFGYQDDEFAQNPDHRWIMAALELKELREKVAAYETERKTAKKTVKRIKEDVPNAPRPGKQRRNGRLRVERDKLSQAKKRLAKSARTGGRHNLRDAASVIESLIDQ